MQRKKYNLSKLYTRKKMTSIEEQNEDDTKSETVHKSGVPYPFPCIFCGKVNNGLILKIHYRNEIWYTTNFHSLRCFKKIIPYFQKGKMKEYTIFSQTGCYYGIRDIIIDDGLEINTDLFTEKIMKK